MAIAAPSPLTHNPLRRMADDLATERRLRPRLPAGETDFSLRRTRQFLDDPLGVLLPARQRYGPVFSLRLFHELVVFLIGPEANHFVLIAGAANFGWREGDYSQLVPLLGDGLLTTDGDYHARARRLLLPAFHHQAIARAAQTMLEEASRAIDALSPDRQIDLYAWARRVAMRIAMRALLGLDPDDRDNGARAAALFERALAHYGTGPITRTLRGPGSTWRRMQGARRELEQILDREIARRAAPGDDGAPDVLAMLLGARDEDGSRLTNQEVRDQLMTLAFAGHDTATSTISFLIYELARHPAVLQRIWVEQAQLLAGGLTAGHLGGDLPELERALEETLRLYPPAWIGPRRVLRDHEFAGQQIPAGAYAAYSSWASHRLPDVFPAPDRFCPERFTPEARAAWRKGAYVPFGGGSRTCIGMRFGQSEVRAVATLLLARFRPELAPGYRLKVRQMPTLGPAGGLPVTLHPR